MASRGLWLGAAGVVGVPFAVVGVLTVVVMTVASASPTSSVALDSTTVPQQYVSLIEANGTRCPQVTAPLLAAQIYQESDFDPTAVSPAGAVGIAQFMPGTWPHWSSPNDGDGQQNPRNPADAIPAMARYDCWLAGKVAHIPGNQVQNMLAAYNAGLGAVQAAHGVPNFTQTQTYVSNITKFETSFSAPAKTVAASSVALHAISFAFDQLGKPYQWGGTGADGEFDCSGLAQAAYASVGVTIPRVANEQWYAGPHVPRSQLQPGDLVFFATNLADPTSIHHVGIYVGNGWMIDAPHTGAVVRFDPIDQPDYFGATRPNSNVPTFPIGAAASNVRN